MRVCKYWYEDNGEYCKAMGTSCACAGVKIQCDDSRYFNQSPAGVARLRESDAREHERAGILPFLERVGT